MKITYSQAINRALTEEMKRNRNLVCFGLGVNDSLKFFGTTKGLEEKFGSERVFETPTSENAMTGIGICMSLYKNPSFEVHEVGKVSDCFQQGKGMRQGCPLSVYLFIAVLSAVFEDVEAKYKAKYGPIPCVLSRPPNVGYGI